METPTTLEVVEGVDLTGKTCVITGASAGLGKESARALATTGAHVILAARNRKPFATRRRGFAPRSPMRRRRPSYWTSPRWPAFEPPRRRYSDLAPEIHVLMNNAGVMFTPFSRTSDGFEIQFGTNHLGHFELTRLLTPQLVAQGARIVILSSDGHRMSDVDLDDPNWERREYDKFAAYGASKTANVLHMVELDRRLRGRGVRAYSVHPGVVATSLARHMTREDFASLMRFEPADPGQEKVDVRHDFQMPEHGAATQVWAAVGKELADVGSVYLADCRVREDVAPYAMDEAHAAELWDLSERLCGNVALGSQP